MNTEKIKANTYFAQNETCMRNGSFYRFTGRKKRDRFAFYNLGDFVGFVNDLPAIELKAWPSTEGRSLLPPSMF